MSNESHASAVETWGKIRNLDIEAFKSRTPHFFLLGLFVPQDQQRQKFATLSGDTAGASTPVSKGLPQPVPSSEVVPLQKREGVSLADKITVGRTQNNDCVITDLLVSKLHGYFSVSGQGQISFTDSGSSNGTRIGGKTAPPFESIPLHSRTHMTFGTRAAYLFVSAEDLYKILQDMLKSEPVS